MEKKSPKESMQDMPNFVIHYLDSCDVLWNCSAYIFFCKIMKYPHYMTQCAITENLFSKKFFFMKMSWFHVLFFCEKVVRVNFQNFHTVYENLDTHRVRQLLHNVVHIRPENFPLKKKTFPLMKFLSDFSKKKKSNEFVLCQLPIFGH